MTKERRLGRGLEALLGRPIDTAEPGAPPEAARPADSAPAAPQAGPQGLARLSVYEIDRNPFQPRREFDEEELRALAESIRQHGLLQPIVVRPAGARYELIAGERRLRAATKAGWAEVPAQIREVDDRQMAEIAIVENLQRRDLNPLEKAASFRDYLERYRCTQEDLAARLSLDRSTIANLIRLLELPEAVQQLLRQGALSQGHARALLPLGEEREQIAFAQRITREGLSVRATEELVQETILQADAEPLAAPAGDGRAKRSARRARSQQLVALEQQLRQALGTKVEIRQAARGRGRIVIHFAGHDEFERLHVQLAGPASVPLRRQAG